VSDKKWYNYFVSVEQTGESTEPAKPGKSAAAEIEELARSTAAPPAKPAPVGRPSSTPVAGKPRPQTVAQMTASVAEPKFAPPAGSPASFDEIYNLAEIPVPPHGYTILKVADMLENEHIRGLNPAVKRSSILVALDAAGVKIDEVIQDAVRRDRALDGYERAQQATLEDMEKSKASENRQIQAELDRLTAEYQARIQSNDDQVAREKERLYGWRLKKQHEEQKIAAAVGYFVTENPITTSGPGPVAPGATPPGPARKGT